MTSPKLHHDYKDDKGGDKPLTYLEGDPYFYNWTNYCNWSVYRQDGKTTARVADVWDEGIAKEISDALNFYAKFSSEEDRRKAAAAPDMYEALKELVAEVSGGGYETMADAIKRAEQAIAKAEGKEVGDG